MFMKDNLTTVVLGVLSVVAVATAQPKVWIDDFQTVTTYDSASLLAPLYEGPPTKYTIIEILISDIFNSRAVSGDDSLTVDHRNLNVGTCSSFCFDLLTRPHVLTVLGVLGLNIGQPGEPPLFESSVKFTSADLCIYGGLQFSPWQVRGAFNDPNDPFGPDGLPGKPGVDDDGDGMTDDIGVGGVDDDSDGTTDEPGNRLVVAELLDELERRLVTAWEGRAKFETGMSQLERIDRMLVPAEEAKDGK